MKISELSPYIPLPINVNPNTMVSLSIPEGFNSSRCGEWVNRFFFDLDDRCFDLDGDTSEYSSGIFLFDLKCPEPVAIGALRMASAKSIPPSVIHSIWNKIAPGMHSSTLTAEPPFDLSEDLIRSMVGTHTVDGVHICNQAIADF